jgi:uncharacterized protein YydD (DUF2326 family)
MMEDHYKRRLIDLEDNINKDLELSKQYEDVLRYEDDPRRSTKYQNEICKLKASADRYRQEYESLQLSLNQLLYNSPGNLIIDLNESGFKFNVEIERDGSQGIGNMKVFCYDLVLAQIWAEKRQAPITLIHDSSIFDGVD